MAANRMGKSPNIQQLWTAMCEQYEFYFQCISRDSF